MPKTYCFKTIYSDFFLAGREVYDFMLVFLDIKFEFSARTASECIFSNSLQGRIKFIVPGIRKTMVHTLTNIPRQFVETLSKLS